MSRFARLLLIVALFFTSAWAKTVKETLRITWEEGAPNGQARELIYTNGQFPSPTLVWDEDDDIEVSVCLSRLVHAVMLTQTRAIGNRL